MDTKGGIQPIYQEPSFFGKMVTPWYTSDGKTTVGHEPYLSRPVVAIGIFVVLAVILVKVVK